MLKQGFYGNVGWHQVNFHRIVQWFGLGGTFSYPLVQTFCSEQGHLEQDQVAQGSIEPDLQCFQGWDNHHLSDQCETVFHCTYRKKGVPYI